MNKLPNGNRVVFVHARDPKNNHAGLCYALEVGNDNKVIAFGVARCGPKDSYNKKIGRAVAMGRLTSSSERRCTVPATPLQDSVEICLTAAKEEFELAHTAEGLLAELRSAAKHISRDATAVKNYAVSYMP